MNEDAAKEPLWSESERLRVFVQVVERSPDLIFVVDRQYV